MLFGEQQEKTSFAVGEKGKAMADITSTPCLHDCNNKTEFGYCKTTGCINPQWNHRTITYGSTKTCGNCEHNDGVLYTSNPPKVKCTITNEYHYNNDICTLDFVPVVRCKDCKNKGGFWCPWWKGEDIPTDWYCAAGERK